MTGQAKQKKTRPVTPDRLMNAAAHYLGRFESTQKRLTEVLTQKARRWSAGQDVSIHGEAIGAVVEKCIALDLVNDARYAGMRARTLLARGKAPRIIAQDLSAKGVAPDIITETLAAVSDLSEREALARLAKRRRLGPFRGIREAQQYKADPRAREQRELAALARAGHGWQSARAFLDLPDEAAVDIWLVGED